MPKPPLTTDEKLDRLTTIVETLAASVVGRDDQIEAHDRQIAALIELASKHEAAIARIERHWQAYINTLPPQ